jgi:Protein of unknown function (DUF1822)
MADLETIMAKSIEIPLSSADREVAEGFAARAGRFADQIRQNTLAVMAVTKYLGWQGYETDVAAGDSWNPALRLLADIADLAVVGLGRLECRVVTAGATEVEIPLEVSEDRLAYVVLEINENPLVGKLLGFYLPEECESVMSIAELGDMDEFIDYLYRLQSGLNILANLPFKLPLLPEDFAERLALVVGLERLFHQDEMDWECGAVEVLQRSGVRGVVQHSESLSIDELQELGGQLMRLLADRWHESD